MDQKKSSVVILMADDDEDDRLMAKEAFSEVKLLNHFYTVENGEELMNYLTPEDVEACFDYWGKLREPMTLIYHRFRI